MDSSNTALWTGLFQIIAGCLVYFDYCCFIAISVDNANSVASDLWLYCLPMSLLCDA